MTTTHSQAPGTTSLSSVAEAILTQCRVGLPEGLSFPGAGQAWLDVVNLDDVERAMSVNGIEHTQFALLGKDLGLRAIKAFDYVDRITRLATPVLLLEQLIERRRSLLFRHLQRRSLGARAMFDRLIDDGLPVEDVVAIVSPPDSTATVPHADGHAILQLQLSGGKTWRYWGVVEDHLIDRAPSIEALAAAFDDHARGRSATQVRLQPGDMLFLPKRTLHHALNHDHFSLSLCFQFPSTWPAPADTIFRHPLLDVLDGVCVP